MSKWSWIKGMFIALICSGAVQAGVLFEDGFDGSGALSDDWETWINGGSGAIIPLITNDTLTLTYESNLWAQVAMQATSKTDVALYQQVDFQFDIADFGGDSTGLGIGNGKTSFIVAQYDESLSALYGSSGTEGLALVVQNNIINQTETPCVLVEIRTASDNVWYGNMIVQATNDFSLVVSMTASNFTVTAEGAGSYMKTGTNSVSHTLDYREMVPRIEMWKNNGDEVFGPVHVDGVSVSSVGYQNPMLADLGTDYVEPDAPASAGTGTDTTASFNSGAGLPGTTEGFWNYYFASTLNPSDVEANLILGVFDYRGTSAKLGYLNAGRNCGWADENLWNGIQPADNDLYGLAPGFTSRLVSRWTPGETRTVVLDGIFKLDSTNGTGVIIAAYVDGTQVYSNAVAGTDDRVQTFRLTGIEVSNQVDFVIDANGQNGYDGCPYAFRVLKDGSAAGFSTWVSQFGLEDGDAVGTFDYDGDGVDNLGEYALGGNPTNAATQGTIPTFSMVSSDGSNVFEYVHVQRLDDAALTYSVELADNLTSPSWTNIGYIVTGTNGVDTTFEEVTTEIPADADQLFLRLRVQKAD